MREIRKALTFRASSIGDCLMGKYLLDNIHLQFPHAKLGIVVASRGAMIRDLLAAAPYIEVIEANRRDPRSLAKLWQQFHVSDFVVTQYAGKPGGKFSLSSKLAARMLAKRRGLIGFQDAAQWSAVLYDQWLPFRPDQAIAEHERDALRAAGLTIALPYPKLKVVPDAEVIARFDLEQRKYIVAHFFAGNTGRGISPENMRRLLAELQKNYPHLAIVISGGAGDRAVAEHAAEEIPRAVVAAGRASLQDMMQIIAASQGVISLDTGIAHMAAQLGKSLVVMHSCLGRNWWFREQYGPHAPITCVTREDLCTPHVFKEYPDCINRIDFEAVARASCFT